MADSPKLKELLDRASQAARDKNLDRAIALLDQALEIDPNHVRALDLLGFVRYFEGRYEESEACCRRALELLPDHPYALNGLGNSLARQGRSGAERPEWWQKLCHCARELAGFDTWGALAGAELVASLLAFTCDDCCLILYQQSRSEFLKLGVNNALTYQFTRQVLARPGVNFIFYGLHSAITRTNRNLEPDGGWYPDQRVTAEEALRAYTVWPAYASSREDLTGTIEAGKWADLTVLSIDPLNVGTSDPHALMNGRVLYTIVDGRVVYEGG